MKMNLRRFLPLVLGVCGVVLSATIVQAQVPALIRYQGTAVDSNGVGLEGPYTLTFRLYPAATGGTAAWEEIQPNVPIAKGQFSVLLGSVKPLTAMDWSQPCWLAVVVNGGAELAPRQQITSVPMAIMAERLSTPTQVRSNVLSFARTASQGNGPQSIIGMGFQPTVIFVNCQRSSGAPQASMGFADADGDEGALKRAGIYGYFYVDSGIAAIDDGTDSMMAYVTSLDSDGFTLDWRKGGAGRDVACVALGLR